MEKITKFRPAWDKRDPNPKKNYGIHCVDVFMVLKGKRGAVHFIFSTGMFLKENRDKDINHLFPMGVDVGYHSPVPQYEGQEVCWPTKIRQKNPKLKSKDPLKQLNNYTFDKIGKEPPVCEWLGIPCYSDGSALRAEEWLDVLLHKGSDEIWAMLEEEYKFKFGALK